MNAERAQEWLSPEDRAALQKAKRLLDDLAEGRRLGQQANKVRAEEHRQAWRNKADELKRERPFLTVEKVALAVQEWCGQVGVTLNNGRAYRYRTILDDLTAHFRQRQP